MLEVAAYGFLARKRQPAVGRVRSTSFFVGFHGGDVVETTLDAAAAREVAEEETQILECHRQLLLHDPEEDDPGEVSLTTRVRRPHSLTV
mmetsp:Transcript_4294/g.10343  ORF Transcript_4294/g.10343 Transcript_4294/m.10343 type:complete len:90 (+) Transcript_4294:659-928(+)